jgi:hypothetical protein
MSDFNAVRTRVAKRKTHHCAQCGGTVEIGQKYLRTAQVHEGDFHAFKQHIDCSDAWHALYELRGLRWDDDQPFLQEEEIEDGEREWLRDRFPAVAERLWRTKP